MKLKDTIIRYLLAGGALLSPFTSGGASKEPEIVPFSKVKVTAPKAPQVPSEEWVGKKIAESHRNTMSMLAKTLEKWEKNKDYIYFDSNGNITTGVGFNVNMWEFFRKIEFIITEKKSGKECERRLTEEEKMALFQRVVNYQKTLKSKRFEFDKIGAGWYKKKFKVKADKKQIAKRLSEYCDDEEWNAMRALGNAAFCISRKCKLKDIKPEDALTARIFGLQAYYDLKDAAKEQVVQLSYRLGTGKLQKQKQPFLAAAVKGDYKGMAKHSQIKGPDFKNGKLTEFGERNRETYNKLMICHKESEEERKNGKTPVRVGTFWRIYIQKKISLWRAQQSKEWDKQLRLVRESKILSKKQKEKKQRELQEYFKMQEVRYGLKLIKQLYEQYIRTYEQQRSVPADSKKVTPQQKAKPQQSEPKLSYAQQQRAFGMALCQRKGRIS